MLRILFLLLVMSSFVFAQIDDKPHAVKYDEFETATNGYVKMIMDGYFVELNNNPTTQGYIFNFGTDREIATREKQIRTSIAFRKYDASRITISRSGFRGIPQTQLWIVPPGAETPAIESSSKKVGEFKKSYSGEIKAQLDAYFSELSNEPNSSGFIVNSGSTKEVLAREKQIKKYIAARKFDLSRIKFLRGFAGKTIKTELWIDGPKVKSS